MTKNIKWTPRKSTRVVTLKNEGRSTHAIFRMTGLAQTSVARKVREEKKRGHVDPLPRGGSELKLSDRRERWIVNTILKDHRHDNYQSIVNQLSLEICETTLRKLMARHHYKPYASRRALNLSKEQKQARLDVAERAHEKRYTRVLFCDETSLDKHLPGSQKRKTIRSKEEAGNPDLYLKKGTANFEKLHLWGAIGINYKSPLYRVPLKERHTKDGKKVSRQSLNGEIYEKMVHDIIGPSYRAFMQITTGDDQIYLLEDNAGYHDTIAVRNAYEEWEVIKVEHPPNSPDLNPIEVIWHMLKSRMRAHIGMCKTFDELYEWALEAWDDIPQEAINEVIYKVMRRYEEVIARKGGAISDWHLTPPDFNML